MTQFRTFSPAFAPVTSRRNDVIPVALEHHPVFGRFAPYAGPAQPGFEIDFLGCRTRQEFLPTPMRSGAPQGHPAFDEEYPEWIDVLESVVNARGAYNMVELGAGFGRWLVRAAAALRQRGGLPCRLVAVEPEPQHFAWIADYFRDNGMDPAQHRLLNAAVTEDGSDRMLYIGTKGGRDGGPAQWYGQALSPARDPVEGTDGTYHGFSVERHRSGWKSIRVPGLTLAQALDGLERVDLVDFDVQGEELRVLTASIDDVSAKVARVHIGTHGSEIEKGLRKLLAGRGWQCVADYRCGETERTPWGRIHFTDGVQSWVNPRLT